MKLVPIVLVGIAAVPLSGIAGAGEARGAPKAVSLDDCESLEASHRIWQIENADAELSPEHVTSGENSLKTTLREPGASLRIESSADPMDWSQHHSVTFDAFNPHADPVLLNIRIDDKYSKGYQDRFEPNGAFFLPPGRLTRMELVFDHLLTKAGRLLDPSCFTVFIIYAAR